MFLLPNLTGKSEEAKSKITCVQMKSIVQALKMYKLDYSKYPSTEEGLELLQKKKYFADDQLPKDSWKNYFIYLNESEKIELISKGSDQKESTNDDILLSSCMK